jgi:V/A-type H+-transporting ATPase subunit E
MCQLVKVYAIFQKNLCKSFKYLLFLICFNSGQIKTNSMSIHDKKNWFRNETIVKRYRMNTKIQDITTKIYEEGVQKAEQEARSIIDEAQKKADEILANASKESEQIKADATKEADQLKARVESELKMGSEQSITLLKQTITELVTGSLTPSIAAASSDTAFIKSIIKELISKWDTAGDSLDLAVVLPQKMQKELEEQFKKEAAAALKKGMTISFDTRIKGGFSIGPKDNSFVISFTDDDFEQYFKSFLKPKTKSILFGE